MKKPLKFHLDLQQVKGARASRLRQRRHELMQWYRIPDGLLPGSISVSYTRCGKPTCRCASAEGHEACSWTFMIDGNKQVERVPHDKIEQIRKRVEAGREFQDAVRDVLAANAELLVLERQQRRAQMKKKR
jgi:hypothetical protein